MKLLQHFKELTVRPKNAQELKGLVLQLAIQGKLTATWRKENPNIESASELLKKTLKKKEEQSKDQKKKKEKALLPLTKDEIPFSIPKTWIWTRLGEVGTTNVGLTYKPAHKNDTGVPVLRSSNVQEGELCLKDLVRVNTDYREKDIIKEGDLLICARNGSRRLVGKCTIIGEIDEVMVFGAFMAIFRSDFNPYLQLFIQSPQYRSKLDGVETTTINQITQGNLKATTVPLPPLEEQKEIVTVVETLFKEVEQLEQLTAERIGLKEDFVTSALNQLTTNNAKQEWTFLQDHFKSFFNETRNIKKLRETVLQLAVQGKLTADWRTNHPDTEDASVLLKRIQKEKAQLVKDKKIKKEKALPPITKDDIPYELPEGWVWCRFGDLITFLNGYAFKSSTYVPTSDYQIIRLGNVKNDNFIVNTKEAYVPSSVGEVTLNYQLFKDDILTTLTGTKNRRDYCFTCLVKQEHLEQKVLLLNQRVGCIRAIDKSASELFNKFLKSDIILNQLFETETGTANQGNIGSTSFKNLVFPLPPLEEQKAIVEQVNGLMGLCDSLEQEVQQSQEYSERLMQSVLKEFFEGGSKTFKA